LVIKQVHLVVSVAEVTSAGPDQDMHGNRNMAACEFNLQ
jgi:hypothetical protein